MLPIEKNSNRAAAQELDINESMVRKWRKMKGELASCKKSKKAFRGLKARWPALEDELEDWVHTQRADGRGISTTQIRLQAIEIAKKQKITEFVGSQSWCMRFLKRKGLSVRAKTTMCQQLPEDHVVKMASFRNYTAEIIAEHAIGVSNIINMDEVPLTFDIPLNRTVSKKGENSVSIKTTGHEKNTFYVCVSSDR